MKYSKKALSLLLTLALLLGCFALTASAATRISYGSCGAKASYNLYSDGRLEISVVSGTGTSDMQNYTAESPAPWHSNLDKITKIQIGKGITSIGDYAFYQLENVTQVNLDASVTKIGKSAFAGMTALNRIFYNGTRAAFKAIVVGDDNKIFNDAPAMFPNEIGTVAVSGVPVPKVGDKILASNITIPEGFTVNQMYWTKKNESTGKFPETADTTFQPGGTYGIYLNMKLKDGYVLYEKVNVSVNGESAELKKESGGIYIISYAFDPLPKELKSVSIIGLREPTVGETVSTSGIKASDGFVITDSYWSKKGADGKYIKTTDDKFQNGGEYGLYVSGKIAEGYFAAESLSVIIGSRKATVQVNSGNYGISYHYEALTQTVFATLNANGGALPAGFKAKPVVVGGTYGDLPTPTREGYTFDGWYLGDKKVETDTKVEKTESHELKAQWTKIKTVVVTFDPDGGKLADADKSKTVTVGQPYGQMPMTTKDGYTFEGWLDAGGNSITAETTVSLTENHLLKAKWQKQEAKTVTVTFDPNGGALADTEKTKVVSIGKAYGTMPTPTKEGFTFLGWYTKDSAKVDDSTAVPYSVDHTLTAKWEAAPVKEITVTFDPAEGKVDPTTIKAEPGKALGALPLPTKEDYGFLGWFDKDGKQMTETDLAPESDLTLAAKWKHEAHAFDKGKITKEASCKEQGTITYTCTVCGETKSEATPLAAHQFNDGVVTKEATCVDVGSKLQTCLVCGETRTLELPTVEHSFTESTVVKEPTCISTGERSFVCTYCNGSYTIILPKTDHKYQTTAKAATLKKNGAVTSVCAVCGDTKTEKVIYRPKTFSLAHDTYTYNGKAKKPTVTVKDAKGNIIDPDNYTVTYSGNKAVGTAKVKVAFKGDYSGSKTLKFKILPKKTAIKKLTGATNAFKATWKEIPSGDGYQIQYATNKGFTKNAKLLTINDATVTAKTIKKLPAGKTYYVRVRTVQMVGEKAYYADWSKTVKVKTK